MERYKIESNPKRGRKPLASNEIKDRIVCFRVTEEEHKILVEKQNEAGFSELAHFVRTHLLNAKVKRVIAKSDLQTISAINRIGTNINQLAKDYNAKKIIDDYGIKHQIKRAIRVLSGI